MILSSLFPLAAFSQASLDSVIAAVKFSNPALIASRIQMEADMKAARTGIYLPNPEVQFDYLWSDPSFTGSRIDFGITQSFSFPTVYFQKSNQSGLMKTNASLKYLQRERETTYQAKLLWIRLVGANRQSVLIDHRTQFADELARKAKVQLSRGEINLIRYHHAQMEYVNLKLEKTRLEIERSNIQKELFQLCGGKAIPVQDTAYPAIPVWTMSDLIGSMAGSPLIKSLENEINMRNLDKQIAVSEWLPKFKTGFYSETVTGLTFQGITTGMSIPLFQNSNTVKTADLRMKTANAELYQLQSERTTLISALFDKRDKLDAQVREIRTALLPLNDLKLLRVALDAGEINISEFFYECSVFYTAWFNLLNSEQELAVTEAELMFAAGK
jgi:outer membrane protein TolC